MKNILAILLATILIGLIHGIGNLIFNSNSNWYMIILFLVYLLLCIKMLKWIDK